MRITLSLLASLAATTALAETTRQLDAHEHGFGALNIAIAGTALEMEFHAPGADIVGFEHAASSAEGRAAVDRAVATLARPLDLFQLPAAAECSVTEARAALEAEEAHDDHDEDHGEDHAEEHGHEEHEEHGHEEHEHEHEEHAHDDHDEDHADSDSHTEFHAHYVLTCATPDALDQITFAYFDQFENARELEVQLVSANGAKAFEVLRDQPILDLRGMF
jgi:hypothetical protein